MWQRFAGPKPGSRSSAPGALLLGLVSTLFWAQSLAAVQEDPGSIEGTVVAARGGDALEGAIVEAPERGLRTLTDAEGGFVLRDVEPGSLEVTVTHLGYSDITRTVEVSSGEAVRLELSLSHTALNLDEVVVTAAGAEAQTRQLGHTIARIDAADLEAAPVSNVSEMLQGREPGVMALSSGGLSGEGARIRIRGSASLTQSNEPVVYVDGVRVDNAGGLGPGVGAGGGGEPSRLDDLNPSQIERIEVLKGSSAAALYGTEASSGVIQIFTKRGTEGAPQWDVEVEQGFSRFPGRYLEHERKYGFVMDEEPAHRPTVGQDDIGASGVAEYWGLDVEPFEVFGVDIHEPFGLVGTGRSQSYSLSVRGGAERIGYSASLRLQDDEGPMGQGRYPSSVPGVSHLADGEPWGGARDANRSTQASARLDLAATENLGVTVGSHYTSRLVEVPENNNNIYGVHSKAGNSRPEFAEPGNATGSLAFATVRETLQRETRQEVERYSGSISADYNPTPSLSLDAVAGVDVVSQRSGKSIPFGWNVDGLAGNDTRGARTASSRDHRELTLEGRGSWSTDVSDDITSTLTAGAQAFESETNVSVAWGSDFPGPGFDVAGAGGTRDSDETFLHEVSAGLFVQEQLGYRDFAFLTLGSRYDWHSAFGEEAGGELYPNASASVIPSDRPGWRWDRLSTLRLRAAVGRSGQQPGAFDPLTTYSALASQRGPGIVPDNLGNPELRPEVATEWEAGAELGLLSDRVALEGTFWHRTVSDALVARQYAPSGGFRSRQLDNIGEIQARGLEMGLQGTVHDRGRTTLELFANAAFLREEVTDLGGAPDLKVGGSYPRYRNFIREGYAPGAFFGPEVQEVEHPIDLHGDCAAPQRGELLEFFSEPRTPDDFDPLVKDCDGAFLDRYLGKPTPDWQGSFGGSLRFLDDFRLSTLVEFRAGNYHVHGLSDAFHRANPVVGRNQWASAEVEATLLDPASTPEERLDAATRWARELEALSPYDGLNEVHRADFLRLREVALEWTAPRSLAHRVRADGLTLRLAGRNLGLLTRWPGSDPEANQIGRQEGGGVNANFLEGVNAWSLPLPRNVSLSARVSF